MCLLELLPRKCRSWFIQIAKGNSRRPQICSPIWEGFLVCFFKSLYWCLYLKDPCHQPVVRVTAITSRWLEEVGVGWVPALRLNDQCSWPHSKQTMCSVYQEAQKERLLEISFHFISNSANPTVNTNAIKIKYLALEISLSYRELLLGCSYILIHVSCL